MKKRITEINALSELLVLLVLIGCTASELAKRDVAAVGECDLGELPVGLSAYQRANTTACKKRIKKLACSFLNRRNNVAEGVDYLKRSGMCPYAKSAQEAFDDDRYRACIKQADLMRLIALDPINVRQIDNRTLKDRYDFCTGTCLGRDHYKYAMFRQDGGQPTCVCFSEQIVDGDGQKASANTSVKALFEWNRDVCNKRNSNDDDDYLKIYPTGFISYSASFEKFKTNQYIYHGHISAVRAKFQELMGQKKLPRIVFLLTFNGRSLRQISRLIKLIYNDHHFYYIHVDERMKYLRSKLQSKLLQRHEHLNNILMADWSLPTMWGGTSLLQMHLRAMQELRELKLSGKWPWTHLINLSESDFPLKSIEELTLYLSQFGEYNFLRFHSMPISEFIKKQGVEYAFLECDGHMWKVSERTYPIGLQFSGGSDWFGLHHKFVDYVLTSQDDYIVALKEFFKHSLLPSEMFFHTVILNSPFCDKFINSNLKFTNWIQKRGCVCQYKHIVDWCGCSPNFITNSDWKTFQHINRKPYFFARKFDPLFGGLMINRYDQRSYGLYGTDFKSLHSYWDNLYDRVDKEEQQQPKYLMLYNYMVDRSIEHLIRNLQTLSYSKLAKKLKQQILLLKESSKFRYRLLNQVHAFFEADLFRGYVADLELRIDDGDVKINFETFFEPIRRVSVNNIDRLSSSTTNNKDSSTIPAELLAKARYFLSTLTSIELSTDYDMNNRVFRTNYAAIMDDQESPSVKFEFDPLDEQVEFVLFWQSPKNVTVRMTKVTMNETNDSQIVVSQLNDPTKPFLIEPGVWTLDVRVMIGNLTLRVVTYQFLIFKTTNVGSAETAVAGETTPSIELGNKSVFDYEQSDVDEFWRLDSICLSRFENYDLRQSFLFDELLPDCSSKSSTASSSSSSSLSSNDESSVYWSSYYPDPKSDLDDLKNIHQSRID